MRPLHLVVAVLALGLSLAAAAGASTQAVVTTHEPHSELLFNPCTDELIFAQGYIHSEDHMTVNEDGSVHHHVIITLQDMKGVSVYGARYVVTRSDGSTENGDADQAPFVSTSTFREQYTRLREDGTYAEGDDFFAYFRIVTITNADGVTTVDRVESDSDCR